MSSQLFNDLYKFGAREMNGIGGAAAGQMMTQMSQRGYLNQEDINSMIPAGANPSDVKKFNTERMVGRMREMSGAVAAMRDLFGDVGRGDAPMTEIFEALEKITQGGMQKFSPARVRQMVRETQQLSKMTGISLGEIEKISTDASMGLRALGSDGTSSLAIAQRSAEFGAAYNQKQGAYTSQGKMSTKEMMEYDAQLTTTASSVKTSAVTNQIGAILRLGDSGALRQGTQAHRLYERLKAGDSSAVSFMNPQQFTEMLTNSGVSSGTAQAALMQQSSNQQFADKYNAGATLVRDNQFQLDLAPKLNQMFGSSVYSAFGGRISSGTAAMLGSTLTKSMFGKELDAKTLHDDKARTDFLVNKMYGSLSPQQRAELGGNEEEIKSKLRESVVSSWANMETKTGKSGVSVVTAHGETMREERRKIEMQKKMHASMSEAMGSLGVGKPMQRLMDAMAEGKDPAEIARSLFGGNKAAADLLSNAETKKQFEELGKGQQQSQAIAAEINKVEADNTMDPVKKEEKLRELRGALDAQNKKNYAIVHGADGKGGLTSKLEKAGITADKMAADKERSVKEIIGKDKTDLTKEIDKVDSFRASIKKNLAAKLGKKESDLTEQEIEGAEKETMDFIANDKSGSSAAMVGSDPTGILSKENIKAMRDKGIGLKEIGDRMKSEQKNIDAKKQVVTGTLRIVGGNGTMDATMVPAIGGAGAGNMAGGNTDPGKN